MDRNNLTVTEQSITPMFEIDGTQIIFQRHCNYDRVNGGLIDSSVEEQKKIATNFIISLLSKYTIDEIKKTKILFVSSNTISSNNFKRCVATNEISMGIVKESFSKLGIDINNIINFSNGYNSKVRESKYIEEPRMFTRDLDYYKFLLDKNNGINLDFWIDFEEDRQKDKREEFGAEGPDEITNRGVFFLKILRKYSKLFHEKNDGNLIIWCNTHYDLISPLVKHLFNYEKDSTVKVEYCAGLSFIIDKNNKIITNINGINYDFDLIDKPLPRIHF